MVVSQKFKVQEYRKITYDARESLNDLLCRIGVPANLLGYAYIKEAVLYVIDNGDSIYSITKILYPEVAKKFGSTGSRVERAIRHAIERAWDSGCVSKAIKDHGYRFRDTDYKPTNSEFIAEVVENVKRDMALKERKRMGA